MNQGSNVSVPTEEDLNNPNNEKYQINTAGFKDGNIYYIKDRTKGGIIKAKCVQNSETDNSCLFKNVVETDKRNISYPYTNPSWTDKGWFSGGKRKKKTQKRKRTKVQKRKRTRRRTQKRR
jgi:hypothetical protein